MPKLKHTSLLLFLASLTSSPGAGYQVQERSTSGLGRSYAGEAAIAEDASAIATNPATLLLLDGTQFSKGVAFINPSIKVSGTSSLGQTSDSGPAQEALVPFFHLSHKVAPDFGIGLSLHSRFGLSTDYADSFLATPLANLSEISTYYISPKLAYKLNDKWSFGAGFDLIYLEGTLTNTVPSSFGGATVMRLEGDDWAHSFNFGTLYQLDEKTRLGLNYYAKSDFNLEGTLYTDTGIPMTALPGSTLRASAAACIPRSLELSALHQPNSKWDLLASVTWTEWSVFETLSIQTPTTHLDSPQNWKDTYRVAIGANYKHNSKWTFRTGLAFDESPVETAEFRTTRLPDSDRIWFSTGLSYVITENYSIDCSYAHVFGRTASIAQTDPNAGSFNGKVSGKVDVFGISFNGKF